MKTNEHLLIHNNTTLTHSDIANSINNIDDKTITKYRNEIKKDTNG